MKLVAHLVMTLSFSVVTATFAGPAAANPTLRDLLEETSRSIQEMNQATYEVVMAKKAYDDQMAAVIEAARDMAKVFAKPAPEPPKTSRLAALLLPAPQPSLLESRHLQGKRTNLLDSLRIAPTAWKPKTILMHPSHLFQLPKPHVSELLALRPVVKPVVLKPLPTLRLADLLARNNDPNGTSIYDSLSFRK